MNEKVTLYRDINKGQEGTTPIYEKWYPKTTDECVIITGETTEKPTEELTLKIKLENLKLKIEELEKEANRLSESIGNIENLPNEMTDIVSAIAQQNSNFENSLYYKGVLPNNKADDADANGIYSFTPETDWGTTGIDITGYGSLVCWGTGKTPGQDNVWCWQRCYFTGGINGAYRARTNRDPWSNWTKI